MTPQHLENGSGPPLVFLHGIGGSAATFRKQLDHFGARGWRAVAWDMPGYGESPAVDPPTFEGWAAALHGMLAALGAEAPVLVGHSIGGMIVQRYLADVADGPFAARAAVLSGTSPAFGSADGDFQRKFVEARIGPLDAGFTMPQLAQSIVQDLIGDDPDPEGVALAVASMAAIGPDTYRANMRTLVTFEMRRHLPEIRVPTLCLVGEKDGNAPPMVSRKMAAKIPGAEVEIMPGAGHLPNMERPAAFNTAVERFLNTLPPLGTSE